MADWKWFALGSAVFAGLTAVWGKIGVDHIPSNLATLLRTLIVVLFLIALVGIRGEWRNPASLSPRSLLFLGLSALATGLSWICYYRALQLGPASLVAPLDKLSLGVTVLVSVLFLGEQLTLWQWVGTTLMVAGAVVLALK